MRKVVIISYYFPPLGWSGVQRTLKFVKYLRIFGWEPVVVTVGETKFSILDKSLEKEIPKDIKIIRVDDIVLKNVTDIMTNKLKEYVQLSINLISDKQLKQLYEEEIEKKFTELRNLLLLPDGNVIWANNVVKKIENEINFDEIDLIYTTSSPYSAHIIGDYIKKKYSIPWVSDFRDQWINNPYVNYDKKSLRFKLESNLEENIVKSCDKLVTTTSISKINYINRYNLDREKVTVITNGYDEEDFHNINIDLKQNKFKIIYNGSFYLNITPYTFGIALQELFIEKLVDYSNVEVILNGKSEAAIIDKFKDILGIYRNVINVNGYLSHKKALEIAANASILLLVCGKGEATKEVYTGKVFEYLRLRRPIISLSPKGSLVEELLKETESGINIEYDDLEGIKKVILDSYNNWLVNNESRVNGTNIKKYERKELTKKLVDLFNQVILLDNTVKL
ncbi:TPR/glycosyl transferase domain-containing protein [Clostridium carnis]|uniref:TPR/glycosyl transferase domain-containing protein n=1 Tax=Clostridium carnis TaxID=1530 RepID=A0ABY6SVV0_9CLOT|nr:glycosyltransferase [Clostridium carnis]VDG72434.1 TPR/glycosyl transferase domain-containing protein [Clostridium carnis]